MMMALSQIPESNPTLTYSEPQTSNRVYGALKRLYFRLYTEERAEPKGNVITNLRIVIKSKNHRTIE